jgi:hypothetical protein
MISAVTVAGRRPGRGPGKEESWNAQPTNLVAGCWRDSDRRHRVHYGSGTCRAGSGADPGPLGHVVMTLSDGSHYQVVSAASEGGISPNPAWIDQHFSRRAAAEVNNGDGGPLASMPNDHALAAFGCSPGVKGAYGTQAAEIWPCRPR